MTLKSRVKFILKTHDGFYQASSSTGHTFRWIFFFLDSLSNSESLWSFFDWHHFFRNLIFLISTYPAYDFDWQLPISSSWFPVAFFTYFELNKNGSKLKSEMENDFEKRKKKRKKRKSLTSGLSMILSSLIAICLCKSITLVMSSWIFRNISGVLYFSGSSLNTTIPSFWFIDANISPDLIWKRMDVFSEPNISKNVCVISETLRWQVTNSKNS